jgi:hypothetical protein
MRVRPFLNKVFFVSTFLLMLTTAHGATDPKAPPPPKGVRGVRQDAQAARVQWEYAGGDLGYVLYAAYDEKHPTFHRENDDLLRQTYIVWDAPRDQGKQFVFYVTAVDKEGRESKPSPWVRVDLARREP